MLKRCHGVDRRSVAALPPLAGHHEPDVDAETAERIAALNRVWLQLTRDQQALLALYAEGYNLKELTDIVGLPLSALKARLHRARVRLGKLLSASRIRRKLAASSGKLR